MRRVTVEPNGGSVELSNLQRQFHFFLRQRQFLQPSTQFSLRASQISKTRLHIQ